MGALALYALCRNTHACDPRERVEKVDKDPSNDGVYGAQTGVVVSTVSKRHGSEKYDKL